MTEEPPVDLASLVTPYTMTGPERRKAMIAAVARIDREKIEGDIVECGVWRGGNIIIARKASPDRVCWLYDTFAGMSEPGPEDVSRRYVPASERYLAKQEAGIGWCIASLENVKAALVETGTFDESKLRFVVGDVAETLRQAENLPDKIALLRLDTDWYASTKLELEVLYPRLQPGGMLIIDDYGHWRGAAKAVDEYFEGTGQVLEVIDYTAVQTVRC